jgi:calcium-dependent protein kinase
VYNEKRAAWIVKRMLRAIAFLHQNGIVHRDVKPENFLYESRHEEAELKLVDFGLSCKYKTETHHKVLHSIVGTPYYVAPEVLKSQYGPQCDVWSVGVIMYLLLCGQYPF